MENVMPPAPLLRGAMESATVPAASPPKPMYETLRGLPRNCVVPFTGSTTVRPSGGAVISATGAEEDVTFGIRVDVMSTL